MLANGEDPDVWALSEIERVLWPLPEEAKRTVIEDVLARAGMVWVDSPEGGDWTDSCRADPGAFDLN